jgi:hypothetical protein
MKEIMAMETEDQEEDAKEGTSFRILTVVTLTRSSLCYKQRHGL